MVCGSGARGGVGGFQISMKQAVEEVEVEWEKRWSGRDDAGFILLLAADHVLPLRAQMSMQTALSTKCSTKCSTELMRVSWQANITLKLPCVLVV